MLPEPDVAGRPVNGPPPENSPDRKMHREPESQEYYGMPPVPLGALPCDIDSVIVGAVIELGFT